MPLSTSNKKKKNSFLNNISGEIFVKSLLHETGKGGYMIKERLGGAAGLRIFSNIFKFHVRVSVPGFLATYEGTT